MSEPRRFLSDPSATPFERDLLESWSEEQPSAAARARALAIAGAAVGVAAVGASATVAAAGSSSSAGAAAGAGGGVVAGTLAPKAAALGIGALTKWIVVGLVVAGTTAGTVTTVHYARSSAESSSPSASLPATTTATPTAPVSPALAPTATTAEPPTVSPSDLPVAPPTVTAPATVVSSAARATAPAHAEETLATEIALFDRARSTLDAGELDRGLGLLDEYEGRFPSGAFTQEAEVLRVHALLRKGNRAAATRAGERFLAAHPTSPHAARVRAMLNPSTP